MQFKLPPEIKDPLNYPGRDLEAMAFAENYHDWIYDEFAPYIGNNTVEVGAGSGHFTEKLQSSHSNIWAIEPSASMYPMLEQRFANHSRVNTSNLIMEDWSQSHQGQMDSIFYINVLEHIEDDLNELCIDFQTLKPGGYLLVFVPALSWLYSDLDRAVGHFRRYHKSPLHSLVQQAGFKIEKLKYFDFFGVLPWYLAFVLLKQSTTPANVSIYDRLVVPVARKLESFVAPPVGKNLLLVAQKPIN